MSEPQLRRYLLNYTGKTQLQISRLRLNLSHTRSVVIFVTCEKNRTDTSILQHLGKTFPNASDAIRISWKFKSRSELRNRLFAFFRKLIIFFSRCKKLGIVKPKKDTKYCKPSKWFYKCFFEINGSLS